MNEELGLKEALKYIFGIKSSEVIELVRCTVELLEDERRRGSIGKLTIKSGSVEIHDSSGDLLVIGDIHGDLETLLKILEKEDVFTKLQANEMYVVFLGDYIDRGNQSVEVMTLALEMKLSYPDRVILLRGNHEGPDDLIAHPHTFPYELNSKFGSEAALIYLLFRRLFNVMPHMALTASGIVMLHGGVPTEAENIEEIAKADQLHPEKPHLMEILWNDPDETGIQGAYPSPRGAGKIFGENCTVKFLKIVGGKIILRGHEATLEGYKVSHGGKIITLFSRIGPPYWNDQAAYILHPLNRRAEDAVKSIKTIT
ncbi:MAG: serine/threonine protein phosphatase [Candidatus Methanomethylicota archaeon]|uniref:Serine/threonine protein phosphatase n=1 Tax=Thermoproteota archaeon TaxID=2056631 RepID=A0A497EWS1_9CREN|nr:MAG: serine/threonine protein phosphatase [Candidatus Verstraetearchaeota archaeon]